MGETIRVFEKNITKQGNEVTPLDTPRSYDSGTLAIQSGAWQTSGKAYSIGSGKICYIRQIILSELSGWDSTVQLESKDLSGSWTSIVPPVAFSRPADESGKQVTKIIDTCIPSNDVSGNAIVVASGNRFTGEIGIVAQIDPRVKE